MALNRSGSRIALFAPGKRMAMLTGDATRTVEHRLRGIVGQLQGIARMVEADRSGLEVLLRVTAVRAALSKVGEAMLASLVQARIEGALASGTEQDRDAELAHLTMAMSRLTTLGRR